MKIMVISDTHGDIEHLEKALAIFQKESFDKLYLLGDLERDSIRLVNPFHERILAVCGNNDSYADIDYARFNMPDLNYDYQFGRHIVLTHGYPYNWQNYFGDYDIFLQGHTHVSYLKRTSQGKYLANPGSLGWPRDGSYSYMTMDEKGMKVIDIQTGSVLHFQDFIQEGEPQQ